MIINLTVKDRCITIPYGYTRPTEGDVGTVHVSFDIQDDDFLDVDKRVTFSNFGGGVSVSLDFADTIEVPHEVITHDGFFISVTAYDPDNKLIARTHRMLKPIDVCKHGDDEGIEPSERTIDALSKVMALAIDLEESESMRQSAFVSGQESRDLLFSMSQEERYGRFNEDIAKFNDTVERAANKADHAAENARSAAGNADDAAALAVNAAQDATDAAVRANTAADEARDAGKYRFINEITLEEPISTFIVESDSNGEGFRLSDVRVFVESPANTMTTAKNGYINLLGKGEQYRSLFGVIVWKIDEAPSIALAEIHTSGGLYKTYCEYSNAVKFYVASYDSIRRSFGNKETYIDEINDIGFQCNGKFEAGTKFTILGIDAR